MRRESKFQSDTLIPELERAFPGCIILKNDEQMLSGIPDLTLLYQEHWAIIEVKRASDSDYRPLQEYYLKRADTMSIGVTIHPQNMIQMISHIAETWGIDL